MDLSDTSSIREWRMAIPPANTPDPKETYRIKRSPSAASEEFLKIDISVRGGTSYLPSEARRIHTPPLPDEMGGRRRKGFFFDYTKHCVESGEGVEMGHDVGLGPAATGMTAMETVTTSGEADWYETLLAEVDELDLLGMDKTGQMAVDQRQISGANIMGRGGRNRAFPVANIRVNGVTNNDNRQRGCPDEGVDWNIPEHLPSSPLCPNHPRYWRKVREESRIRESGKDGDIEVEVKEKCWMHR